jgi:hypothetical protein
MWSEASAARDSPQSRSSFGLLSSCFDILTAPQAARCR